MMLEHTTHKEFQVLSLYRRLRILYNRIAKFGYPLIHSDWYNFIFNTKLGRRRFVCSYHLEDDLMVNEYCYYNDSDMLFKITSSKKELSFISDINPMEMWLAIHEIEQITDRILMERKEEFCEV